MAKRSPRFQAVLFDIDGTLLDTREMIFQSFEHTLAKHNIPKSREEVRPLIGKSAREIYKTLAPTVETELLIDTHFAFQTTILQLSVVFAGAKETLATLKKAGMNIAALTNRIRTSRKSMEIAGIAAYFDLIITPEELTHPKPHPESVEKAIARFKVSKDQTILIGDTHVDILTGKNAGVTTIGVTYGIHGENLAQSKPDFLVNDIADILPIIIPQE